MASINKHYEQSRSEKDYDFISVINGFFIYGFFTLVLWFEVYTYKANALFGTIVLFATQFIYVHHFLKLRNLIILGFSCNPNEYLDHFPGTYLPVHLSFHMRSSFIHQGEKRCTCTIFVVYKIALSNMMSVRVYLQFYSIKIREKFTIFTKIESPHFLPVDDTTTTLDKIPLIF
ncbi:hypothetical protein K501DRAFT_267217 [Backusella circina FSU 941]|nr:hypothetical protein K501DRAFT_267217 [Backusella circina FSU 941]